MILVKYPSNIMGGKNKREGMCFKKIEASITFFETPTIKLHLVRHPANYMTPYLTTPTVVVTTPGLQHS